MANVKKTLIATTVAVATLAAPATAFADDANNIQPDVNGAIEQAQNAVSQTQDTVAQATQAAPRPLPRRIIPLRLPRPPHSQTPWPTDRPRWTTPKPTTIRLRQT